MGEHPDVVLGSTPTESGSIEVTVSGVDVRLSIRGDGREVMAVFLAPDCAVNLRDLLDRALDV
jgi:hypothetical protein